ncbi:MAG: putative toxin-antitoxin system toxin component, PIN family [Limnohabitans sp.]
MTHAAPVRVVLDTNIVLDLWLYQDPATPALLAALENKSVQWLATQVMRDELERVLAYTHIAQRLALGQLTAPDILAQFDAHAQRMPIAAKAQFVCKDADDQKFIDLAAEHRTQLISKDKAVLTMRNRMARLGVAVGKVFPAALPV